MNIRLRILCVLSVLTVGLPIILFGQIWREPVLLDIIPGTKSVTGGYPALENVGGKPAMAYLDATHWNLMFVRAIDAAGTQWELPQLLDMWGDVGSDLDMEIVNGKPAISYMDFTGTAVKYIIAKDEEGKEWNDPVIIDHTAAGMHTSLSVINGKPAVTYYDPDFAALKYCQALDTEGSSWQEPTIVDTGGLPGQFSSLQIVKGFPAISYYDYTDKHNLKYVRALDADGASWENPIVLDSIGDVGYYTSMQVINGKPAIAYTDATNRDLKFVMADDSTGSVWKKSVRLDSVGIVGSYPCLRIIESIPTIVYYDQTNGNLKWMQATDETALAWETPVELDTDNDVGVQPDVTIINGYPAIAYNDNTDYNLKFIRATNPQGTAWNPPVSIDENGGSGFYLNLAIVNGHPAAVYGLDRLRYTRALDSLGTEWSEPIILDDQGYVGEFLSFRVVGGKPSVTYMDGAQQQMKFIRAADENGTQWLPPVTLPSWPDAQQGYFSSLEDVHGNPAVVFTNGSSEIMIYARASDPDGTSWSPVYYSYITDEVLGLGSTKSLRMVNGRPAIAYGNETSYLHYVRSLDNLGQLWDDPVQVDPASGSWQYPSMYVVNGYPAIAYYDMIEKNLKYVRATDIDGKTWGVPLVIDSENDVGRYASLDVIDGHPAVAYYDNTSLNVKYIRALDADGKKWDQPVTLAIAGRKPYVGTPGASISLIPIKDGLGIGYYDDVEVFPFFIGAKKCFQPTQPVATKDTLICQGKPLTLKVESGELKDATDWMWHSQSSNGPLVGTGSTLEIGTETTTLYYVKAGGGCVINSPYDSVKVQVVPHPTKPFVFTGFTDGHIELFTTGSSHYQWYRDGVMIPGETEASLTVTEAGSYTVEAFNLHCGTLSDEKVVVITGVEEKVIPVLLHPNPADQWVTVSLPEPSGAVGVTVEILDLLGRTLVSQNPADSQEVQINIESLTQGTYLVKVHTQRGTTSTRLLVSH